MIPKRIYLIWIKKDINAPIPELTLKFIDDVKKWCLNNNYEHILIDNNSPLLKECLLKSIFCRKQLLLSRRLYIVAIADYLRLYVLNKYGGIYLDTDVKVHKGFDKFLNNNFFIGQEPYLDIKDRKFYRFDVGTIGSKSDNKLLKFAMYLMDSYLYNSYLEGPKILEALKFSTYRYNKPIDMWVAIPDLFPFILLELWGKTIIPVNLPKVLETTEDRFEVFDETFFSANGIYTLHCFHTMWNK